MNHLQPLAPARPCAAAGAGACARPAERDDDAGFSWLVSSLDLKFGLQVQTLRIDPLDADWRELFRPS